MNRRQSSRCSAAQRRGRSRRGRSNPKWLRIGTLYIGLADAELFKNELREGLRELGYMEGQNIAFEFRSAEGKLDRLPEPAAELVRLKVDVIDWCRANPFPGTAFGTSGTGSSGPPRQNRGGF